MNSERSVETHAPVLVALEPPKSPTDIIQSALFIPISHISPEHKGRKIRTIGQILSFDAKRGILLLAAVSDRATGSLSTLLINISTPLLGMSLAMPDMAAPDDVVYSRTGFDQFTTSKRPRARRDEVLKLDRGDFVTVVGWMEGDGSKLASRVRNDEVYRRPMSVVLEAIHIANARPPPTDAIYRGDLANCDFDPPH